MKRLLHLILILIIFTSCLENSKTKQVLKTDKYNDLYTVIDELLRFRFEDCDIVILELNRIYTLNNQIDEDAPPPPGAVNFNDNLFSNLQNEKLLDSLEILYMKNQMKLDSDYVLDSNRIDRKTLKYAILSPLFGKYGIDSTYEILKYKYNAHSFIRISSPLLSKDGNKMLLDIQYYCGGLCGSGMTFLFEKKNKKWRIIYTHTNWIS